MTWTYGLFEFWDVAEQSERIFLVAIMLVLQSLRSPHNASILPIARTSAATVTLAIITRCLMTGGSFYLAIAGVSFFLGYYILKRAERQYEAAVENFAFRAEKDALIAELERERENSDGARRRAEDANIAKSHFLANISHELRTPLNAIIGFSEVMKEELMGPHALPAYKDYSGDIYNSGQHLLKLINEILDLSRIEAGRYELREKAVEVDVIGEGCLKLIKLRADQRGVALKTEFEDGLPAVYADDQAIRQIWLNLISNAIKFTPRDGQVTLTVKRGGDGAVVCSVRDTGPGIPEREIPLVLSSFGQGSLAQEMAEEGAGLGLPIVQGLMQLHGGTFQLASELRVGTEAIFSFPADRVLPSGQTRIEHLQEKSAAGTAVARTR